MLTCPEKLQNCQLYRQKAPMRYHYYELYLEKCPVVSSKWGIALGHLPLCF
jgi:hypothetical protein